MGIELFIKMLKTNKKISDLYLMASTETATAIIAGIEEFKKMCLFLIGVLIISVLQSMPRRIAG